MKNKAKISIATPCHEDWNTFEGKGNKRFCGSCVKNVYDLRNKSDDELNDFLEQKNGESVCAIISKKNSQSQSFLAKIKQGTLKYKHRPFKLTQVVMFVFLGVLMNFISSCTTPINFDLFDIF